MDDKQLLVLKWNNHRKTFFSTVSKFRVKALYTDVILACDGQYFNVHKMVLSSCSEYFQDIFEKTECKCPVIILKDIRPSDLGCLLDYMYLGEVEVKQDDLNSLIKAAECLKIKGLALSDDIDKEKEKTKKESERERKRKQTDLENPPQKYHKPESPVTSSNLNFISHSNNTSEVPYSNTVSSRRDKTEPHEVIESIKSEPEEKVEAVDFDIEHLEPDIIEKDDSIGGTAQLFDNDNNYDESFPGPSGVDESSLEWPEKNNTYTEAFTTDLSSVHRKRGTKKHLCPYCARAFEKISHWRDHCRIHTGEKPYKCSYCDYRAIQKSTLKSHVVNKHSSKESLGKLFIR